MPNTIAQNLTRLQAAKTAIGAAITAKGGTVASGDGLEEFATDIGTIPSGGGGGGGDSGKPVRFIDYDGTVVASYTAVEFAQLTAMPPNLTHAGLTAQGWNWSFSDAQAYVAAYGMLDVGQMYITDDGKTRLYIELTEGRISPWLKLYLNANSELDIDWGDGGPHSTFTSTSAGFGREQHNYVAAGSYVICITVISGGFELRGSLLTNNNNSSTSPDIGYMNSIKSIEIGDAVTSIGSGAFNGCTSLSVISIPTGVTSIGNNAFYTCYSLSAISIPTGVTSIGSGVFNGCNSLSVISIPTGVTSIGGSMFSGCNSLSVISIPTGVTSIGDYAFNGCSSLSVISVPTGVTRIGENAFNACYSLSVISIPTSVTSIASGAFTRCYSLSIISIPASVTSIGGSAFSYCYSLYVISIDKPDGSISGSPWGATTGSPTNTQIIWRTERYKSSVTEISTGTTLTGTVDASEGDLVVATFVIRGNTYTISEGWTLLGISNTVGTANQRTAMAYKIANSSSESITITQDTSARIYINLVSITGASAGSFSGFTTQEEGNTITMNKPQGLVIWGVSSSVWGQSSPYSSWGVNPGSDNRTSIQLPNTTQPRCLTVLDQSNDETVSFTYSPSTTGDGALAAASLTITGIPNFWYF